MCVHPIICPSASSSGLPENSGLKCDQFNCGIGAGWNDYVGEPIHCAGSITSCMSGTGGCTAGVSGVTGGGCSAGGAGSPSSAIFTYNILHSYPNCIFNWNITNLNYMFYKNCKFTFYYLLS